MDLRQLSALQAVADHGSFSAAARALHTVQSNISTHVARLERELGVTLVDRAAGTVTEEGMVVVQRARRIRSELDALLSDVSSLRDEVHGAARVGVIGTTARWLVPLLVDGLGKAHPQVHLVVVDATTSMLLPQLNRGELDLAVANLPTGDGEVTEEPLFDEDRVLIAPSDHPLAAFDVLTLEQVADHELLLSAVGTVFRSELDADAAARGVTLRAKAEVDGLRLAASLAFQGFGAAVLPSSAAPGWLEPAGRWKRIPLTGLSPRSVGLVQRRRGLPSAAARAAAQVIREVVRVSGPDQPGIHPATSASDS
ncbi:MAG: LysR family transcriptional regulator [Acidimicrobiia bacterium]|nr:LysR family transcriptional regulator [Acidimicrobiia bacterium]